MMQDLPQNFAAVNQLTMKAWEKAIQELGKCKTWFSNLDSSQMND